MKRVAAVHDLAGFGKCALTIVMPTLAAAGIECCPVPTAVLSSHTGGLPGVTCRDLTEEIAGFSGQWANLQIPFHGLYSGYLSSPAQVKEVLSLFRRLRGQETLALVDPVMGDNGSLYRNISREMAGQMQLLCREADILTPNLTEACFLLGMEYPKEGCREPLAKELLERLCGLGPRRVVLTGVLGEKNEIGAAAWDRESGEFCSSFAPRERGNFHGTGDLFASVLLAALLRDFSLQEALQEAVSFTALSIRRTVKEGIDPAWGVAFEDCLPKLMRDLHPCCNEMDF